MNDSQSQGKKKEKLKGAESCPRMDSDYIRIDLENDCSKNIDLDDIEVDFKYAEGSENKAGVKRTRKDRSPVWQCFTKLPNQEPKLPAGKIRCKCNKCNTVFTYCSTQDPTANLYYPQIFMAYLHLHESLSSSDEYMRKMGNLMMTKFQKYWSEFSLTLAIAVVLDPRYKLKFIEWSYEPIYGEDSPEYDNVDQFLHSTFNEYAMLNMGNGVSTTTNVASGSDVCKVDDTSDDSTHSYGVRARLKDFDQFQSKDSRVNKKSELELYLDESMVDRNSELDVLAFWKANEFRYPALARMARDFLTIPISTVASESTFSASGRVLNEHRSSLSKDTVEALICTKDWLFGDYCSNKVDLTDVTEDIMSLDISRESNASNSVSNPKP